MNKFTHGPRENSNTNTCTSWLYRQPSLLENIAKILKRASTGSFFENYSPLISKGTMCHHYKSCHSSFNYSQDSQPINFLLGNKRYIFLPHSFSTTMKILISTHKLHIHTNIITSIFEDNTVCESNFCISNHLLQNKF